MKTRTRLLGLKKWLYEELCEGRSMKAPSPDYDITKIVRQEPKVFLGWQPSRSDNVYASNSDPVSVCPSITVMPNYGSIKYMEEKRFDRYNGVRRPDELGQELHVDVLFSVYEPGERLPGFIDEPDKMELITEGTEAGLFTLTDWMDECCMKLLGQQLIPGTDLFLIENSAQYSLYTDQNYVVDKRPLYYGYLKLHFGCYAEAGINDNVLKAIQ